MEMIPTIYPFGSVNIRQIHSISKKGDRYYFFDKCGRWRISKETYEYLKEKGFENE